MAGAHDGHPVRLLDALNKAFPDHAHQAEEEPKLQERRQQQQRRQQPVKTPPSATVPHASMNRPEPGPTIPTAGATLWTGSQDAAESQPAQSSPRPGTLIPPFSMATAVPPPTGPLGKKIRSMLVPEGGSGAIASAVMGINPAALPGAARGSSSRGAVVSAPAAVASPAVLPDRPADAPRLPWTLGHKAAPASAAAASIAAVLRSPSKPSRMAPAVPAAAVTVPTALVPAAVSSFSLASVVSAASTHEQPAAQGGTLAESGSGRVSALIWQLLAVEDDDKQETPPPFSEALPGAKALVPPPSAASPAAVVAVGPSPAGTVVIPTSMSLPAEEAATVLVMPAAVRTVKPTQVPEQPSSGHAPVRLHTPPESPITWAAIGGAGKSAAEGGRRAGGGGPASASPRNMHPTVAVGPLSPSKQGAAARSRSPSPSPMAGARRGGSRPGLDGYASSAHLQLRQRSIQQQQQDRGEGGAAAAVASPPLGATAGGIARSPRAAAAAGTTGGIACSPRAAVAAGGTPRAAAQARGHRTFALSPSPRAGAAGRGPCISAAAASLLLLPDEEDGEGSQDLSGFDERVWEVASVTTPPPSPCLPPSPLGAAPAPALLDRGGIAGAYCVPISVGSAFMVTAGTAPGTTMEVEVTAVGSPGSASSCSDAG